MATFDYKARDGKLHTLDLQQVVDWLMVAPAIVARTGGSPWELAWDGTARRSNPDSGADTAPNAFTFVAQTGVAVNTIITSASVAIAGITAASTVSVSGGEWRKNAGTWGTASGTVVVTDTVQVRHTSAGGNSTITQTTLTIGGVQGVFTSTTVAGAARVGILYQMTFDTFSANVTNPAKAAWPASTTAATDGCQPLHIGMAQFPQTAGAALPHLQIVSSNPTPVDGTRCAKFTIYPSGHSPAVNYAPMNGGGGDKPRVNLVMKKAHETFNGGAGFAHRTMYWIGLAVWLPSDYEEETEEGWNEIILQCVAGGLKNNFDLELKGKTGGGAAWTIDFNRAPEGSTSPIEHTHSFALDVETAHKGHWNYHVFQIDIDNRLTGGSPIFRWWHNTDATSPVLLHDNTSTAYGYDNTSVPGFAFALNLYKGGWHGATQGAYTGGKTSPIVIAYDAMRIGSSSSNFNSVHPTQAAPP